MFPLSQALSVLSNEELAALCSFFSRERISPSRDKNIACLTRNLTSNNSLKTIFNALPEHDQLVVQEALFNNGVVQFDGYFLLKYGQPINLYADWRQRTLHNQLNLLIYPAWIQQTVNLVIPDDIRHQLHRFIKYPSTFKLKKARAHAPYCFKAASEDLSDFTKVLDFVAKTPCKIADPGLQLAKECYAKLLPLLSLGEPQLTGIKVRGDSLSSKSSIRIQGMVDLLLMAKLIEVRDGLLKLTELVPEYMQLSLEKRIIFLYEGWLQAEQPDELWRLDGIRIASSFFERITSRSKRAGFVHEVLLTVKTADLVTIDSFIRKTLLRDLEFMRRKECNSTGEIFVGDHSEYEWQTISGKPYWFAVEGLYLRAVLMEYLANLGIVEVFFNLIRQPGQSRNLSLENPPLCSRFDAAFEFRITEFGRFILEKGGGRKPPKNPRRATFRLVRDNLFTLTSDLPSEEDQRFLESFTDREPGESIYRIDFDSLAKARSHNVRIEQIKEFMQRFSDASACPAVMLLLDSWRQIYEPFSWQPAIIIQSNEPQALGQLLSHAKIAPLVRPISATQALVSQADFETVRRLSHEVSLFFDVPPDVSTPGNNASSSLPL